MPFKDKEKYREWSRKRHKIKRKEIRAYRKKWKKETGDDKKYYEKNKAAILEKRKQHYIQNRSAILERNNTWHQRKKERTLKKYFSDLKYERSEGRKEKKKINQRAYKARKKLKDELTLQSFK